MFSALWRQPIKSAAGIALGAFFVLFTDFCHSSEHDCPPFGETETVYIKTVVDGDTVQLTDGRKVRLIGINTPELGRDSEPDQPFAVDAKSTLRRFLGRKALLLTDRDRKDSHKRTLAHLYNMNGESAEAHLLGNGLGWHVAVPPNLTQAECLADAERIAREKGANLWGHSGTPTVAADDVTGEGFQRITGKVTKISFGKRGWWINMGRQIAAVIYPEHQHRFDRQQLENLNGETITVRGWVYPSRSKKYQPWRVKLETPFGIESVDASYKN